jgi:hypothetical protein
MTNAKYLTPKEWRNPNDENEHSVLRHLRFGLGSSFVIRASSWITARFSDNALREFQD